MSWRLTAGKKARGKNPYTSSISPTSSAFSTSSTSFASFASSASASVLRRIQLLHFFFLGWREVGEVADEED
jgi:hypothetical protein